MRGVALSKHFPLKVCPDEVAGLARTREDVGIPKAEDTEAAAGQLCVARHISKILRVLGTVGFNDELAIVADEVSNV